MRRRILSLPDNPEDILNRMDTGFGNSQQEHYIYLKITQYKREEKSYPRDNSLAVGQELPKLLTRVRSPVIASVVWRQNLNARR